MKATIQAAKDVQDTELGETLTAELARAQEKRADPRPRDAQLDSECECGARQSTRSQRTKRHGSSAALIRGGDSKDDEQAARDAIDISDTLEAPVGLGELVRTQATVRV